MDDTILRSTKVLVLDLERAAAFYKAVAGLEEGFRYQSKSGAHEIVLKSREGESGLILMEYAPMPEHPQSNIVLVFMTKDALAFGDRVERAGGGMVHEAQETSAGGRNFTIVLAQDAEGNRLEAVQEHP